MDCPGVGDGPPWPGARSECAIAAARLRGGGAGARGGRAAGRRRYGAEPTASSSLGPAGCSRSTHWRILLAAHAGAKANWRDAAVRSKWPNFDDARAHRRV